LLQEVELHIMQFWSQITLLELYRFGDGDNVCFLPRQNISTQNGLQTGNTES